MDISLLNSWYNAIDEMPIDAKYKASIKTYVYDILDRDGVVIIDSSHLAALTGINNDVMNEMINYPQGFYRVFSIPKRTGGLREVSAPYPSLMKVQRWIYDNILLPKAELSNCAKGFVPGLSVLDNATPHIGAQMLLKMDLHNFFPSINIKRVICVFENLGYYHQLSYYLAALCCKDGGLPQGAPTSPILSNIIAKRLDHRLEGLSKRFGLSYTRYADDLTFSGNHIPAKFIDYVRNIITSEGFSPNEKKTQLLNSKSKKIITGVSVSSGKATIPKQLKRKMRQEEYYVRKYGIANHMKHEKILDSAYPLRLKGYFAYWKVVEPKNEYVLRTLNNL